MLLLEGVCAARNASSRCTEHRSQWRQLGVEVEGPQKMSFSETNRSDDKADGDKMPPLKSRVNYLVLCDGHSPLRQPFLALCPERVKEQPYYLDTP